MDVTQARLRGTRRSYSVAGFSFVLLFAVAILAQLAMTLIVREPRWHGLTEQSWWTWVSSFAPMYLFAFPAGIALLHVLPGKTPEDKRLSPKQFWTLIPICFCLMYAGNLVGTLLSLLLSGGQAVNQIETLAMDQSPLKILVMVVLAPVLEELICRKLLIDRTARYGEKLSVLMSGLIFGLLHQNLYQFFYAFALGSLFAYVYIRTGRIRYTMILHAIVNFLGSVVAPAVVSLVDMEAVNELAAGDFSMELLMKILPGYSVLMLYSMALMGVSVFGLVLLIIKARRLVWIEAEQQLPRKMALKAAFLNAGMIIYILICLAMTVLALFNR